MSKGTAIRLPDHVYERLNTLAANTGRSASYYIREAIETHLDDLEDAYLGEKILRRVQNGEGPTYSLDQVEAGFGLDR